MKILLVEDEISLVETISHYLKEEGYLCEIATDYNMAIEKIGVYEYDCILVDITLPHGSGLDVVDSYKRHEHNGGIIIISAKNSVDDKIKGLELGADDYLTKPFHLHELNTRIKSLHRRLNFSGERLIKLKDIVIDPDAKSVTVNDTMVPLTKKEYEILLFFIQNPKRVLSKGSIAEHLWGDHMDVADSYDFIYSQIKNVRKKINSKSSFNYFHAVYGVGYKFLDQ
ncbi:response regulator transcription factor [Fulvivirga sediminis]|uniref:Response regulator transcription factor n=1 Tax=Fulvivirga sediminis TaxID=2803949 RepID=A0A937JXZ7_9BACT|nr:response regulator transcription factor [Fulvivirga sediminis]MBL3655958.1 response regulator transcription factor [Fulvivirga sediminis]